MRVLFIAMSQSIHTARWLNQFQGLGWDIHLFPSLGFEIHEDLRNVTVHGRLLQPGTKIHPSVTTKSIRWYLPRNILYGQARRFVPWLVDDSRKLARLIDELRPDVIHSLEIQHSGYLTLDAVHKLRGRVPPWIVTNWGSDTYYYSQFPIHRKRLQAVFSECSYYTCECERDVVAARDLGFKGHAFPVMPNTGGFDFPTINELRTAGKTSQRRVVVMKGYENWAGRALAGLHAIELCKDELRDYVIKIYLASNSVVDESVRISRRTGLRIEIVPTCNHVEMLKLHGSARASIGVSVSDGVSTSFLEAIAMGSFPIQTCTACVDEWIVDGISGRIVSPTDVEGIAQAIRQAVTNDNLVDRAAEINAETARQRLNYDELSSRAKCIYKTATACC